MDTIPLRFFGVAVIVALCVGLPPKTAQAQSTDHVLLAQSDPDESFDPFSDYSEFDEASDEEADVNFFRNGRFFTIGVSGGMRMFTGNLSEIYGQSASYGLTMSYFFDLRSALALNFLTGDHAVKFGTKTGTNYSGNVSISSLSFDYKHYFNTQNITRGLADLNPYALLGFGQFYRTYSIDGLEGSPRDATMGVNLGVGLEIPLMRRKGFLGIQATYHSVNFSDENKEYVTGAGGSEQLTKSLSGDFYDMLLVIGMNF